MDRDDPVRTPARPKRPAYPSLLDLALRTGRWTLAAGGAAAVIATGGAGCGGGADGIPGSDQGTTTDQMLAGTDAGPLPDIPDVGSVPDEGSMPEQVMAGMDVGPMPEVELDVEEVVPVPDVPVVPDVPDASYPELAGADPGSAPDVPAVPDAVDDEAVQSSEAAEPAEVEGDVPAE